MFAAAKLGAIVAALNWRLAAPELAYILVVATLFLMLESMTDNELPHDAALTRVNRCIRTQDT